MEQLEAGYLTYLLRSLGGLAKRLWVYLESQKFERCGIGKAATRLWLAPPLWQALGVTHAARADGTTTPAPSRRRIAAVDRSLAFELRKPPKRGGTWSLVVRRRLPAAA